MNRNRCSQPTTPAHVSVKEISLLLYGSMGSYMSVSILDVGETFASLT